MEEIGETDVGPALARTAVGAFLLLVFGVPLCHVAWDYRNDDPGKKTQPWPQAAAIFTGVFRALDESTGVGWDAIFETNSALLEKIDAFESALDSNSVLTEALQSPVQSALVLVGAGNERAYIGREQWLFYRQSVDYLTGPGFLDEFRFAATSADPRPAILDFRRQLAERGVDLVLVPVPPKAAIHPEQFVKNARRGLENPSYAQFLTEMQQAGVHVLDLTGPLSERAEHSAQYLESDTHWTPNAMEFSARLLVEFLREHDLLSPGSTRQYRRFAERVSQIGDIARMLRLPRDQQLFAPQKPVIHPVRDPAGLPWRSDVSGDVLLLGDSFANIYSSESMGWGGAAGFGAQLSLQLQRPIDAVTQNDNGAYATREALQEEASQGRDPLDGKTLVVWQFAMRELFYGEWKTLDHEKVGTPERDSSAHPASKNGLIVVGRVTKTSRLPDPRTVEYPSCLFVVEFEVKTVERDGVSVDGGSTTRGDALSSKAVKVAIMGMRNFTATEAARYRAGDRLRLSLVTFREAPESIKVAPRVDDIPNSGQKVYVAIESEKLDE